MATDRLLKELEAERDRIQETIDILSDPAKGYKRRNTGRHLSASAKRSISEKLKQRWAERKAAQSK
jgi:hypothetical protein